MASASRLPAPRVITKAMAEAAAHRFWPKVNKEAAAPCWVWSGAALRKGYGILRICISGDCFNVQAHRLSYVLHKGEIPPGLLVRHTCDTPGCVQPDHLVLGTHTDNMADMVQRGRQAYQRGEYAPSGKLTEVEVREIITLLAQREPPSMTQIAKDYGISRPAIHLIRRGVNWSHVEKPTYIHPETGAWYGPTFRDLIKFRSAA